MFPKPTKMCLLILLILTTLLVGVAARAGQPYYYQPQAQVVYQADPLSQLIYQRQQLQYQAKVNALQNQNIIDSLRLFNYITIPQNNYVYAQPDLNVLVNQTTRNLEAAQKLTEKTAALLEKEKPVTTVPEPVKEPLVKEPLVKEPLVKEDIKDPLTNLIQSRCVKCHNPDKKSGEMDMTLYYSFTGEQKTKVQQALISNDPTKRMPKKGTLSFDEILLFK